MLASALTFATTARAGDGAAAAQTLFEEARALIAAGNYAAGCAKLEGSQALDPGPGTQYNLALCYEKSGRTASAWATYLESASAYQATNRPDWEAKARDRATALANTLSKVTIVSPPGAPGDLAITRDGVAVVASELGVAIPVDPGQHVIAATAHGRAGFHVAIVVAPGESKQVDVVLGEPVGAPVGGARDHTLAYVVGGVGIAGLAFGAVTGLGAINKNASSTKACPEDGVCRDAAARRSNHTASDWATASTIGFIAGGALLASGVVLFMLAPPTRTTAGSRPFVRPSVGLGAVGLVGAW